MTSSQLVVSTSKLQMSAKIENYNITTKRTLLSPLVQKVYSILSMLNVITNKFRTFFLLNIFTNSIVICSAVGSIVPKSKLNQNWSVES